MSRIFKTYICIWTICLALFNVIVFVVPIERNNGFWIGYSFITVGFIGQLCCTYMAFRKEKLKQLVYNIPIILISHTGLVVMLIVGAVCMVIPELPNWFGIISSLLVLSFTAIFVTTAGTSSYVVERVDEKVAMQTGFVKDLIVDAENLMHRVNAPMLKRQCQRVYEAIRYSDPMSSDNLRTVEQRIKEEFDALTDAVISDDLECTESAVKELLTLIEERNNKCKLNK